MNAFLSAHSLSMAPLLMHSADVPRAARAVLRAAVTAPPERRTELLTSAARILSTETELECQEILDLVGLPASACR